MTTNEVLVKTGLQYLFRDPTDFDTATPFVPATAGNSLIITGSDPTEVDIDLTGLVVNGSRESDKFDWTTPWGRFWSFDACLEFETAPADGGAVHFYLGQSPITTAATGNPGGLTGTDADFTETSGNLGQLRRVGTLVVRNNVINIGHIGIIRPAWQYGILLINNQASTALRSTATAMDETHIVATEMVDEIQAAA